MRFKTASKMTIKIISCSVPGIWYQNKIGLTYEVEAVRNARGFDVYKVKGAGIICIYMNDAEEVKTELVKPVSHRELITIYSNKKHVA